MFGRGIASALCAQLRRIGCRRQCALGVGGTPPRDAGSDGSRHCHKKCSLGGLRAARARTPLTREPGDGNARCVSVCVYVRSLVAYRVISPMPIRFAWADCACFEAPPSFPCDGLIFGGLLVVLAPSTAYKIPQCPGASRHNYCLTSANSDAKRTFNVRVRVAFRASSCGVPRDHRAVKNNIC